MSDLICREELKKALHSFFDGKVITEPAYILRDAFCLIDNAPTVADRTEEVLSLQNTIAKLVDGISENARPKGEWIISQTMDCHSDIINVYTCPFCKEKAYSAYPYCHCGAEMRGAGDETNN